MRHNMNVICAAVLMLGFGLAAGASAQETKQQERQQLDQLQGYDQLKGEKSVKKDVTNMPKQQIESVIVWSEAKPTNGKAPLKVDFAVDPVPGASIYTWQFGDGSAPATGTATSHTFTTPGVHRVMLKVSGAKGPMGGDELRIKVTQ